MRSPQSGTALVGSLAQLNVKPWRDRKVNVRATVACPVCRAEAGDAASWR